MGGPGETPGEHPDRQAARDREQRQGGDQGATHHRRAGLVCIWGSPHGIARGDPDILRRAVGLGRPATASGRRIPLGRPVVAVDRGRPGRVRRDARRDRG
jgi:hypothetical protein